LQPGLDFSFHPVAEQREEQDEGETWKNKHLQEEPDVKSHFLLSLPVRA
jgi:hypothetical protein